ncbi:MAG: UDP-glucose dehydrogenase family protein [Gammaproteobacteria bacterium]
MRITIFGTGYVGLVTGACFAENGHEVLCIDVDSDKIARLQTGEIPIYEPGLDTLVKENVKRGQLRFSTDGAAGVRHGTLLFIAVGTPPGEDGSADVRHVLEVARTIGSCLNEYKVVITKSTVPVGTTFRVRDTLRAELLKRSETADFDVVSNPEFLKEGAAVQDFMRPDRIIVGVDAPRARELLKEAYASFIRNHDRMLFMDITSAELTKYAANAFLATKISFMNEMAQLADTVGADIELIRQGIGSDPRIGYHFLYAGVGYGGSCFPKDVRALIHLMRSAGMEPWIVEAVERRNRRQKTVLFDKIRQHFGGVLTGVTLGIWGLAYKPHTDDLREAPSLNLIRDLMAAGALIRVHDPAAMAGAHALLGDPPGLFWSRSPLEALEGADALVLVTEWPIYKSPDWSQIATTLRSQVVFDGRNLYDPKRLAQAGFRYYGIGRKVPA